MNIRIVILFMGMMLFGVPPSLGYTFQAQGDVGKMIPTPEGIRRIKKRHVMNCSKTQFQPDQLYGLSLCEA